MDGFGSKGSSKLSVVINVLMAQRQAGISSQQDEVVLDNHFAVELLENEHYCKFIQVILESEERGVRRLAIDEHFFLSYRKSAIETDEVVKAILIPFTRENQFFNVYKQAQRREDDVAIVTGAFNAVIDPKTLVLQEMRIAFGGMAPTTKLASNTVQQLQGKWNQSLLDEGLELIANEFSLPPGVPGGMARYRQALTLSLFLKFFLDVANRLNQVPVDQPPHDPVGRAIPHVSGVKHVTGEAIYCGDMQLSDCLHMAFVMSPIASGTLEFVDPSDALEMDGVVDFIGASDVPEGAKIGHMNDTPIFVKDKITYHGQPIGAIIAVDHETARRAANAVKLKLNREKAIISIEDAIESDSYLGRPLAIHSSLLENDLVAEHEWSGYDHVVEGEIRTGGQEHFYLETSNCIVIPHEDDEMEIIISTQGITGVQVLKAS
uniref:Ald_Xan_dh_C domain-containing protein n=1 Tax=Angiostrongylus cantonensis TaxID=6313 RepID=A0A0K0DJC3_ANGCA